MPDAWCSRAQPSPDLPVAFELKNQETWKPLEYMDQAKSQAIGNKIPIVVMSKNRLPEPLAMLELKDLIWLLQLAKESGAFIRIGYSKRKQVGR